jgi:hypothetical protein
MGFKKWLVSKPRWFQYVIAGALGYPSFVLILFVLAFITTPLGLRPFFESVILVIVYPAYSLSILLVYRIIENSNSFNIYIIVFGFFFSVLIGSLIGVLAFLLKFVYLKITSLNYI